MITYIVAGLIFGQFALSCYYISDSWKHEARALKLAADLEIAKSERDATENLVAEKHNRLISPILEVRRAEDMVKNRVSAGQFGHFE